MSPVIRDLCISDRCPVVSNIWAKVDRSHVAISIEDLAVNKTTWAVTDTFVLDHGISALNDTNMASDNFFLIDHVLMAILARGRQAPGSPQIRSRQ